MAENDRGKGNPISDPGEWEYIATLTRLGGILGIRETKDLTPALLIALARASRGLTVKQLSRLIDSDRGSLALAEKGREIKEPTIKNLAKVFGQQFEVLLRQSISAQKEKNSK